MSNPIWAWWFGDGSLAYANAIRSTSRATTRRRFLVFLAAIGATHGVGLTFAWADNGALKVKSQQPKVWSPTHSLAMMLANQGPDDTRKENAPDGERSGAGTKSIPDLDMNPYDDLDLDASRTMRDDENRKQRLQEMLQNSSLDESSTDRDAPLSAREVMSDTDNIAEQLSDKPPLSSTGEVGADGNRNANTEYFIKPRYPSVNSGRFILPPLRAVSIAEKAIGSGQVPKTVSAGEELNRICVLPEDGEERVAYSGEGYWPELIRPWAAPNTFSHPLYFEDRMLERHGHERWGCFQPLASGTRFFATMPMLPYLATVQPPCEFVYTKGYYRVGSPTPKFFQRPPLERRAIIVEAAAVSGAFIALP